MVKTTIKAIQFSGVAVHGHTRVGNKMTEHKKVKSGLFNFGSNGWG